MTRPAVSRQLASSLLLAILVTTSAARAATSTVTLKVPPQVLIGEPFKFQVKFNTGTAIGFGPFIDLVLDMGGANITKPPGSTPCACDGISFIKAEIIGVSGGPTALTPSLSPINTTPCGTTPSATAGHPLAASGILPLTVPPGAQLVTFELPFGSFAMQPEVVVEVTAQVSPLADFNFPLKISARGGFHYGSDPSNNPTPDPPLLSDENPPGTQVTHSAQWAAQAQTTPTVLLLEKDYLGPEDETATGPNFPHPYKIKVDLANGQSIANLKVQDFLPNNVQYQGLVSVMIGPNAAVQGTACTAGVDFVPTSQPPTTAASNPPNNELEVSFCHPVTGTPAADDVTVTFAFFIPGLDANGSQVLGPNCKSVPSPDDIKAECDWTPQDPCDTSPVHVTSDVLPVDHTLADKCIAIQKQVAWVPAGHPGPIPGDTLKYELDFQISDYKTLGNLQITDYLTDGQQLVNSPAPPMLTTIGDRFPNSPYTNIVFNSSTLSATPDPAFLSPCPPPPLLGINSGTRLVFDVSGALIAAATPNGHVRHQAGILTGGFASTPSSNVPAKGKIVFYAKIQDQFAFPHPPGDPFVDKDDPLANCVTVSGRVFANAKPAVVPPPTGVIAHDTSNAVTAIVTDTIKKSLYAVKSGSTFVCGPSGPACSSNPPQEVHPGDQVTFQIVKRIPSGDAEQMAVQDWLPLPVFDVKDPDANGTAGPSWSFSNSPCGIPAPGVACLGTNPPNTLSASPTLMPDPATNSIKLDYGNFNDPANQLHTVDLLFTSTVTPQPFANGLFLTNEAQECENNTFGVRFCQPALAQVNVREPKLQIRKGVIATDDLNGLFSQPASPQTSPPTAQAPAGVTFSLGGFTGLLHSPLGNLIDSDLSNVDANDLVTFAITIENQGGHPAYDVQLRDVVPPCFQIVPGTTKVTDGNHVPLPYTPVGNLVSGSTITLAQPIPALNASGTNIVVITFQGKIVSNVTPGCCKNVVELQHYAAQPGGPDFVSAGFTPPFQDPATVCVLPQADKCVTTTSEAETQPDNSTVGTPQVTLGEIVRYHLWVSLPEGVSPFFRLTDHLPPGMTYMNDGTTKVAFVSNLPIISTSLSGPGLNIPGFKATCLAPKPTFALLQPNSITGGPFGPGVAPTFWLGTLTNNDNDSNLEFVVVEFNALVNNIPSNVKGVQLSNYYDVFVGKSFHGQSPIATSPHSNVVVVEPNLAVQKSFAPIGTNGVTMFTVTITNTAGTWTSTAFDVAMNDTLPAGLVLFPTPAPTVAAFPGCTTTVPTVSVPGNAVAVDVPQIPPGCGVTVTFPVFACSHCVTNIVNVSYSSLPGGSNNTPVGTQVNNTGSVTPCAPTTDYCERLYTATGQASINDGCSGSLTVTKQFVYQTTLPPPPGSVFQISVACQPSGPNTSFNLSGTLPTQTVSNIPVGSTCTVTEGPLPPPYVHPACASVGWLAPVYLPGTSVVISSGAPQTVVIQNTLACLP